VKYYRMKTLSKLDFHIDPISSWVHDGDGSKRFEG
jgi:hypothetical protein